MYCSARTRLSPVTPHFIRPDWPAPHGVLALSTTRQGGASAHPWNSLNMGHHVGDTIQAVATNRARLAQALPQGSTIQWLEQVHGIEVVEAGADAGYSRADASWSRRPGVACAVMTADCLPVLFTDNRGEVIAAAHAGWRGLLDGVLQATVKAMAVAPCDILAWLGPAIGPQAFEVGPEVREAFLADSGDTGAEGSFVANPERENHYFADLYQLARQRLVAAGVSQVYGDDYCTFSDPERFYSYRRDGQTGRMASLILLAPGFA